MKKLFLLIMSILCISNADANVYHGKASWYSVASNRGTATASGQKLSNYADTVAHRYLPLGTKVKVTNKKNGNEVICIVNDRGPYKGNRILDVTMGVAEKLGFKKQGLTEVKIEVVGKVKIVK